jgi:hypothetical protein
MSEAGREAHFNQSFARLQRIAARIPTYVADAIDNPEWLVMFALGRVMPVRQAYRRWHPIEATPPVAGGTIFGDRKVDDIVASVRTDGIFQGLSLPERIAGEIHEFALATPCFANMDRQLEFSSEDHADAERRFGRPVLTGQYFDRIKQCPAVATVRQDPLLHTIAAAYLGPQARLAATRLWWSFPTKPREQDLHLASQDRFHFDLDDWQTLKFFFYLTAVDADAGPHVYMRGSHRQRRWKHQLTLLVGQPTDEVLGSYGAGNMLSLTGARGFGFAEDPFGFHMGAAPKRMPRLMMEVAFGVSAASRRRFYGEPVVGK